MINTTFSFTAARGEALETAKGRLTLIGAVFVLCYILVAARLIDLAVIQGSIARTDGVPYSTAPQADKTAAIPIRSDITDRNGVLLATSLETASLYADPALIPDPETVAANIAHVFPELSKETIVKKLEGPGRFVWVKRHLTPEEQYAVLELGHPGLAFQKEYRRVYPQGSLASHITGYTNIDGKGLGGIERGLNDQLTRGEAPVRLTLDVRLQYILHRELSRAITDFTGKGGSGVIMDIQNGDILAAVSLPDFDPHDPGGSQPDALFDRLTLGVYELGSPFKIFSTAALLEYKGTDMARTFDARKPLEYGRFRIRDFHPEKRIMTVPEVFMHSSNIGSALMGEAVEKEGLQNFYRSLGLFDRISLDGSPGGHPLIPEPWRDINTLTASYGHGIAVSPLSMVTAAAALAGEGLKIEPSLLADREKQDIRVRVAKSETVKHMQQLLRLTVTDGTGMKADVPGYRVGGKTGTAEKPGPGGYDRKRLISSFLGFFPMEAPRYAVFVMVDEPQGTKESWGYATGGWVAAPAAARIIETMAPLTGLSPKEENDDIALPLKRYIQTKEE